MVGRPARLTVLAVAVVAAVVSAATVFTLKKEAERDARAIGELGLKIAAERQRISELQAEWSALDHPARLQRLVDRHNAMLSLEPVAAEQIASITEVASAVRRRAEERAAEERATEERAAEASGAGDGAAASAIGNDSAVESAARVRGVDAAPAANLEGRE